MDALQTARLTEQAVGRVFADHDLACHIVTTVQGPHTWTVVLRLYQPRDRNIKRALGLARAVEAALGDSPVRIYTDRGLILVEVPNRRPLTVVGPRLRGRGLAVPLGVTSRQGVVGVDFEADPHLLVVGPTGRGKTTAMRLVVYHLLRQNRRGVAVVVAGAKPKDWAAFEGMPGYCGMAVDPSEVAQVIRWAKGHMAGRRKGHLFLVLDDLLSLLAWADIASDLADMVSLGRASGLHLIAGTQWVGKQGAGGVVVTANMPVRLVFGTASATDAAILTGRGGSGAEALGVAKGDALLVSPDGMRRVAVGMVTDQDIKALAVPGTGSATPPHFRPPQAREPAGSAGSGGSGGSVQEHRVLTGPARTKPDFDYIRRVYRRTGGNKTRTCMIVWGYKNGDTWAWLEQALAGTEKEHAKT